MNRMWVGVAFAGLMAAPLAAQMGDEEEPEIDWNSYAETVIKSSDGNGDGKVTLDEVVKAHRAFQKAMRDAGDDEEKQMEVYMKLGYPIGSYFFGNADTNGDKVVTKDELVAYLKVSGEDREIKYTLAQLESMATIEFYESGFDKNDDGTVTKDEAGDSWDYISEYDSNKDGKLTKDEYYKGRLEALKTIYEVKGDSTNPKDPKDPKDPKNPGTGEGELKKDLFTLYTKKGRTWTVKTVSKYGDMETVTHMRYEVTSVGEEEAEFKVTMLDKDMKEMGVPATTSKISFRVPKGSTDPVDPKAAPQVVDEKIKVKAGEFECTKTTSEVAGNKSTVWISKKYGGLMVKMESSSSMGSTTMELVEFKD